MTPDEQLEFWNVLSKPPKLTKAQKGSRRNDAGRCVSGIRYPDGWRVELLSKSHNRQGFSSGQDQVDTMAEKVCVSEPEETPQLNQSLAR